MITLTEVTEFVTLLAILLGGGMIGAGIMKRIKFPTIIGFVIIGMLAGPYGLGIVEDVELINLLAEFGIIILLFTIGLEFSIEKLRKAGMKAIIVGTSEIAIMFFLGYITAFSFGWNHLESLYLAGILAISSTAISMRLLRDMKLIQTKEFNTVITILIVEDLVAVLLLVILGNASAGAAVDIFGVGQMILQSLAFFVISLAVGIKLIPKLMEKINNLDIPEGSFITALALGFGMAALAHFLGQSTAIGAFLMGMMIASSKHSKHITEKVLPLRDFFVTIFFVSVGMLVNIFVIPSVVLISIPIIVLAVMGKFVGNFFGATVGGHDLVGASTVGAVMVPRGEFSFIIAKQGIDTGTIRDSLYPVTMLVTLATMLLMPLLLRALPTLIDKRTYVPEKILNPLFTVGIFFRQILSSQQGISKLSLLLKKQAPKFFINLIVVVAILAIIDFFKIDIINAIKTMGIPTLLEPELFLTVISMFLITYPIISLVGKIEYIVGVLSELMTGRLASSLHRNIVDKPIHRLIRNILFIGLVLIMVSIIQPYISGIASMSFLPLLISGIGLIISITLIVDTIFVFQRISRTHIMDTLLKEDEYATKDERRENEY